MDVTFPPGIGWPYSTFHEFRLKLAKAINIDLDEMELFGGKTKWSDIPVNPINVFLMQPDNDGNMTPDECEGAAGEIYSVIEGWPDNDHYKKIGQAIAKSMMNCATKGENLNFG